MLILSCVQFNRASLISAVCILDCCCLPGPKKLKRLGVELGAANLCQSLKKIVLRNFVNHTTILTYRFFLLLIKVPRRQTTNMLCWFASWNFLRNICWQILSYDFPGKWGSSVLGNSVILVPTIPVECWIVATVATCTQLYIHIGLTPFYFNYVYLWVGS